MAWPHYLVQYQVSCRDENCRDACPEPWACNGADNNTHLHDVDGTVVELPIGSKSYYSTSCNQGIAVDLLLQPRQEMLTIAPEVNACMHARPARRDTNKASKAIHQRWLRPCTYLHLAGYAIII